MVFGVVLLCSGSFSDCFMRDFWVKSTSNSDENSEKNTAEILDDDAKRLIELKRQR